MVDDSNRSLNTDKYCNKYKDKECNEDKDKDCNKDEDKDCDRKFKRPSRPAVVVDDSNRLNN